MSPKKQHWWKRLFGNKEEASAHYELVQGERNLETGAINYKIRKNGQVLIEQCDYVEGYNHLHQFMKAGDTFQEIRTGGDSSVLTYRDLIAGNIMMGNIELPDETE